MRYRMKYLMEALLIAVVLSACGAHEKMDMNEVQEQVTETKSVAGNEIASESEAVDEIESIPENETVSETLLITEEALPEAESEPEPWSLHLIMVGDVLLHDRVEESALDEDGHYDFSALFANTKEYIEEADLALVNQEVIIGGEDLGVSGYPNFNAPYEIGDELVETGFDVICHATNHALDRNGKGITSCLEFWENEYPDIDILGIHDEEENTYIIYEKDGVKIAILNYTYGTNGIALPSEMPYAVDLLDEKKVAADIQKANEEADFTIVCPHWGTEYRLEPDSMQKKWTQIFLDNGVDLVLGTHPHVIEPVEMVTGENAAGEEQEMLVYYSLGNFVNWTSGTGDGTANRMVGGMADVILEQDEDGQVFIKTYDILPLVSHVESGFKGVTTYFLSDYSEELGERNEIRKQDATFSTQYAEALCDEIWGSK